MNKYVVFSIKQLYIYIYTYIYLGTYIYNDVNSRQRMKRDWRESYIKVRITRCSQRIR